MTGARAATGQRAGSAGANSTATTAPGRTWDLVAVGVLGLAMVWRLLTAHLPNLAEASYEEALVGLMARGVLAGEHTVFWWGHPYLGTLPVYATALLFAVLGTSTFALRLTPILSGMAGLGVLYLLARRLWGPRWGLLALAWLAIPPAYLSWLSVIPYDYVDVVTYGILILYLSHRLLVEPGTPRLWWLLGFLWGLAVWEHLLSLCYVGASALALTLFRGLGARRPSWRDLGAVGLGLATGGAPLWLWNVAHGFETMRDMISPAVTTRPDLPARLPVLGYRLVGVLGNAPHWDHPWLHEGLTGLVVLLYGAVIGYAVVSTAGTVWRHFANRAGGGSAPSGVDVAVLALVLACVQMVFSEYDQSRYLAPVYAAVPILVTAFVRRVSANRHWVLGALIAVLAIVHGTDNTMLRGALATEARSPRPVDAVVAFLEAQGIRHAYGHFRVAWPIMFESRGRVTTSDFHAFLTDKWYLMRKTKVSVAPFLAMRRAVDASPRVAIVTHERLGKPRAAALSEALRPLGGRHRAHRVGDYTVFYGFEPPPPMGREIPPSELGVAASHGADRAAWAIDRHIGSTWVSRIRQVPGITFEVELAEPRRPAWLVLDPGNSVNDYPRALRVEASVDGKTWQTALEASAPLGGIGWHNGHARLNALGRLELWLGPIEARRLRLVQTADPGQRWNWSIAELFLYEAGDAPAPTALLAGELRAVIATLAARGVSAVYGTDELQVRLFAHLPPSVRTVPMREPPLVPVQRSERVIRLDRRNAFCLPAPSPVLERGLTTRGVRFETRPFGSGVCYLAAPLERRVVAYWAHGQLLDVMAAR